MTSEINGDLDPDIPPKNFKKISKSAKKIIYGVVKQFYDFLYFAVNPAMFQVTYCFLSPWRIHKVLNFDFESR